MFHAMVLLLKYIIFFGKISNGSKLTLWLKRVKYVDDDSIGLATTYHAPDDETWQVAFLGKEIIWFRGSETFNSLIH